MADLKDTRMHPDADANRDRHVTPFRDLRFEQNTRELSAVEENIVRPLQPQAVTTAGAGALDTIDGHGKSQVGCDTTKGLVERKPCDEAESRREARLD